MIQNEEGRSILDSRTESYDVNMKQSAVLSLFLDTASFIDLQVSTSSLGQGVWEEGIVPQGRDDDKGLVREGTDEKTPESSSKACNIVVRDDDQPRAKKKNIYSIIMLMS